MNAFDEQVDEYKRQRERLLTAALFQALHRVHPRWEIERLNHTREG